MKYFIIILSLPCIIKCDKDFLVVEGEDAAITQFPHSTALFAKCNNISWRCGASIVNQRIMLTAAHCVERFTAGSENIMFVTVGHRNRMEGGMSSVERIFAHDYSRYSKSIDDIALLKLKTSLTFNDGVQRVALMENPPYYENAQLAGWGLVKETYPQQSTNELHYIDLLVWKKSKCKRVLKQMDSGSLCASSRNESSYVAHGDSGSALLVRGYIQIGIASYKNPLISRSLMVYTEISHYYYWIRRYSRKLYCAAEKTLPDPPQPQ